MFGRKTPNQPTRKESTGSDKTDAKSEADSVQDAGALTDGQDATEFRPKGAAAFTPSGDTPSFTPDSRAAPTFTPPSSVAAPPLKPFAQRGTQMPSRPMQTSYKQQDMPRRGMDIPGHGGHGGRRTDAVSPVGDGKTLTVGREIQLSGEISACDHLVVEGKVQANLANARILEVAEGGQFLGKVTIEEADISGLFEGEMTVTRLVTVRPTGKVSGILRYESLVVEDGGKVQGTVSPLSDDDDDDNNGSV
ncbi:bactofilin family protein [Rhodospirillum sp. A1_3_36]|uniref:bactofilin family protein n=1 Tax=Rhodospirillum sp. A1_3_36 TaxID=3391666 RepID=UPI0039A786F2